MDSVTSILHEQENIRRKPYSTYLILVNDLVSNSVKCIDTPLWYDIYSL